MERLLDETSGAEEGHDRDRDGGDAEGGGRHGRLLSANSSAVGSALEERQGEKDDVQVLQTESDDLDKFDFIQAQ